jgi:enediyne polyketide synthase
MTRIAVVGLACVYPDAMSPADLWDNALAGRRAFRRLPDVRMRSADYWDPDPRTPDKFYARTAAVLEGYEFDRVGYRVAGSTYRSTDLTHWLALDVAARALADAGFKDAEGLPRDRTTVIVGNSLTGEFTRANQLRVRWPYVRRTVAAALSERSWEPAEVAEFVAELEQTFKAPFPPVDEDTLAGALSNTIAGRICNHFDLRGGGYTVDGACSSSLLSVISACRSLLESDVDVAVAGGVDLSIDPFELVGFAKTGALATGEMRVYDRSSNGFWPGEGCGMVVLMREPEARAAGHHVYASIAGWGVSSDGHGGMTRPEVAGYRLALDRAYARAGFGIDSVGLFEGHGTGTAVGDATELGALSAARSAAGARTSAAVGSIKGMIGHTKAAAGIAGFIKAALALHHEVVPPSVGSFEPHELLTGDAPALRIVRKAEPWPAETAPHAGVTAMGFGGINTHLALTAARPRRRLPLTSRTAALAASAQDAELLAVDADDATGLAARLGQVAEFVVRISYGQLADLAATLHGELRDRPFRAAVVASSPEEAHTRLSALAEKAASGAGQTFSADGRSMLGHVTRRGRIGLLFPGQGSGRGVTGGAIRRRFAEADGAYSRAALPTGVDVVATEVAQPRIVTGSVAGLSVLSGLGIEGVVAVGHSLGEIAALHWAGVLDADALVRIAATRGRTMAAHSADGTMADIGAPPAEVERLVSGQPVVVAAYNGPGHTVIAGSVEAVTAACATAAAGGLRANLLPVSHAFHSPLVAPAAAVFGATLTDETFRPVGGRIVSTVTGDVLAPDTDVPALLHRQITDPVLFAQAVDRAAADVDLFVEVGPGRVLTTLAAAATGVPAFAQDTDDESIASLLGVVGAAFVVGAAAVSSALFHGRLIRPLSLDAEFAFLASPCEAAPVTVLPAVTAAPRASADAASVAVAPDSDRGTGDTGGAAPVSAEDLLRELAAARAELPIELVRQDSKLLDDLHFSSITVGQVVNEAARRMNVPATHLPTNFAVATVRELAQTLETLAATADDTGVPEAPVVAGAASWVRAWRTDLDETAPPARVVPVQGGSWQVFAPAGHPYAEPLRAALTTARLGDGVLVCLPDDAEADDLEYALLGAQSALAAPAGCRFVLVGTGRGAAGLAKTLHLEAPRVAVTSVHVEQAAVDEIVMQVVTETAGTTAFSETWYVDGVRRTPMLRPMPVRPARVAQALTTDDVLLVTGGGKGITAECALALAAASGARLALLGRGDPATDSELAAGLQRIAAAGIRASYRRADVTDAEATAGAVSELAAELGPVTAVLHGAGCNEPVGLADLSMEGIRSTLAPKIGGLRAVLAAIDPDRLRLLVTLGSIIGRTGLRGEAHYATANDQLADLTAEVGRSYPHCRALCLEWSVWSGVGMGERLSVVESLSRDGITPVTVDDGIRILDRLISDPDVTGTVVVSGRTGELDTVRRYAPALPLLRFTERPLVRYHGVELVTETELNAGTDRYLADHELDGNLLFPAVFGMEAMTQVATALTGVRTVPIIENAEFLRPIVVPPHGSVTIRIAAVQTDDDVVEVAVRSAETGFTADHFTARLRFGAQEIPAGPPEPATDGVPVPLVAGRDLYGPVLFQGERFQRLGTFHRVAARNVDAELIAREVDWFADFVPNQLLLGDPGVRDALMHGNQVCVPDATLLPAGVDRIYPAGEKLSLVHGLRYQAAERSHDGDTYVYDIALRDDAGEVIERWEGLRLRAVRRSDGRGPWTPTLLGTYLERSLEDLAGAGVTVAVEPDPPASSGPETSDGHLARRRARTRLAAARAYGRPVEVGYRADGRPEVAGEQSMSASHGAGVTLVVTAPGPVGCDIETVVAQSEESWQGLLGGHAALARHTAETIGEDSDTMATRVWTAIECLQKAGLPPGGPLVYRSDGRGGWVLFAAGPVVVATLATSLHDHGPVVVAILTETS